MMHEPDARLNSLTDSVIGAAIEVHRHLGPGYLESVYEKALCVELDAQGVPHRSQVPIPVQYKGVDVGEGRLDILVANTLPVELKAVEAIHSIHKAQVISYLKATGLPLGLLINFNVTVLHKGVSRVILTS